MFWSGVSNLRVQIDIDYIYTNIGLSVIITDSYGVHLYIQANSLESTETLKKICSLAAASFFKVSIYGMELSNLRFS